MSLKAAWASEVNLPCFISCLAFLVVSVSLGNLSSNFDPKHHLLLSKLVIFRDGALSFPGRKWSV